MEQILDGYSIWASQVVLVVKKPPANAGDIKMWVQSLDWEDPLEEGMATHSSVLTWRMPWTEEPGRIQSMGSQRVEHDQSDLAQIQCLYKFLTEIMFLHIYFKAIGYIV